MEIVSDNVSLLTLLLSFKATGSGPATVAREIALDLADMAFAPKVLTHTPGVAHKVADFLSRRHAPGGDKRELPLILRMWVEPSSRYANPNTTGASSCEDVADAPKYR